MDDLAKWKAEAAIFERMNKGPLPDLADIKRIATAAAEATSGGAWAWDDGVLIELDHDSAIGIATVTGGGSLAAPHIVRMDPLTTLALVAWIEALQDPLKQDGG